MIDAKLALTFIDFKTKFYNIFKKGLSWLLVGVVLYTFARKIDSPSLLKITIEGLISEFSLLLLLPGLFFGTLALSALWASYHMKYKTPKHLANLLVRLLLRIRSKFGSAKYSFIFYTYGVLIASVTEGFYQKQVTFFYFVTTVLNAFLFVTQIFIVIFFIDLFCEKVVIERQNI